MSSGSPQEWATALERDGRVELELSKGRLVLITLACLVFALIGLVVLLTSDTAGDRVMGSICVLMFGAGLVIVPRQLVRSGPAVVVDQQGITVPRYEATLPWSEALGTGVFSSRGTHLVQVEADKAWLDDFYQQHKAAGLARGANKRLMGGADTISLPSPLKAKADDVAAWLGEEIARRRTASP